MLNEWTKRIEEIEALLAKQLHGTLSATEQERLDRLMGQLYRSDTVTRLQKRVTELEEELRRQHVKQAAETRLQVRKSRVCGFLVGAAAVLAVTAAIKWGGRLFYAVRGLSPLSLLSGLCTVFLCSVLLYQGAKAAVNLWMKLTKDNGEG